MRCGDWRDGDWRDGELPSQLDENEVDVFILAEDVPDRGGINKIPLIIWEKET